MKMMRFALLLIFAAVFSFGSMLMVAHVQSLPLSNIATALTMWAGVTSIAYACMVINDFIWYRTTKRLESIASYFGNASFASMLFAICLVSLANPTTLSFLSIWVPFIVGAISFAAVAYRKD